MDALQFGKHKGTPLAQVPRPYLEWLLANATSLHAETREAIVAVLKGRRKRAAQGALASPAAPVDHVACHRCGGSAKGRTMIHLECIDQDDAVPF